MKKAFFITIMSALLICSCQKTQPRGEQFKKTLQPMGALKIQIHSFYGP